MQAVWADGVLVCDWGRRVMRCPGQASNGGDSQQSQDLRCRTGDSPKERRQSLTPKSFQELKGPVGNYPVVID